MSSLGQRRFFLFFIVSFVPALFARISAFIHIYYDQHILTHLLLVSLRGILSDIAIAFIFSRVASKYISHTIALILSALFWSFIYSGNLEYVLYNFSNISLYFLKLGLKKEFIFGSVLVQSLFLKFGLLTFITFSICAMLKNFLPNINSKKWLINTITSFIILIVIVLPIDIRYPNWIQANIIEDNLRDFAQKITSFSSQYKKKELEENLLSEYFTSNLKGKQRVQYPEKKSNVILFILEGLNVSDVNEENMPNLKKISEKSLFFTHFLTHQRQTNRGVYSLICGDYPNLKSQEAKADHIGAFGSRHPCIPHILSDVGYKTVYMESSNLGYTRLDLFAKEAGYEEIYGNEHYINPTYHRNGWGVDDAAMLEEGWNKILNLRKSEKPWFLTIETCGTHHPYNVPKSFLPNRKEPTHQDALKYLDLALSQFIDKLRKENILQESIIFITSDESHGIENEDIQSKVNSHLAPLIVLTPYKDKALIEDSFMQADLLLSMSDYLDLHHQTTLGQSIFRKYTEDRNILFADVYQGTLFLKEKSGDIIMCDKTFSTCHTYKLLRNADKRYLKTLTDETSKKKFMKLVEFNDITSHDLKTTTLFYEKNTQYKGGTFLLGGYIISAKKNEVINWNVDMSSDRLNKDVIQVAINAYRPEFIQKDSIIFGEEILLFPGQTINFYHSFVAKKEESYIWTNVIIRALKDSKASVNVHKVAISKFHNTSNLLKDFSRKQIF